METCTLKRRSDGNYELKPLKADIRAAFNQVFDNITIKGVEHYGKLPSEIKKALYSIGDKWNNSQINVLVDTIESYINTVYGDALTPYLPSCGIKNCVSKKLRDVFGAVHSAEEYFEQEDADEAYRLPFQFLDETFGNQAKLKNELKQKVTHQLLNSFIIDRERGSLVTDITSANCNAKHQKQQLFYNAITTWAQAQGREVPSDLRLFDDQGKYTGILETPEIKAIVMASGYDVYRQHPDKLQAMRDAQAKAPNNPHQYDAFTDWFTLMNYDNFVKLLLGDAIDINPKYRGKFVDDDSYAYASKSGNLITSYRTNENIDLFVEINRLTQALINSTPFVKAGTTTATGKYIRFDDFFRLTTKIKDLALDPRTSSIVFHEMSPEYLTLDKADQPYVKNKSLREIINSIRNNPQIYAKLTFQLFTPKIMEQLGFTEEERDKTWSIYKGIFDSREPSSINAIQSKYDHRAQNYYNMITEVTDSIFSINFLQYYENEGVIQVHNLRDQGADDTQRNIEANITSQNSRRILSNNYEYNQMKPWSAHIMLGEEEVLEGIEFTVGDIQVIYNDLSNGHVKYVKDGKQLIDVNQSSFTNNEAVIKFIDEQLHLDLNSDHDLIQAMGIIFNGQYLEPLMSLATRVYFNKYISNNVLKDIKGYTNITNGVRSIYKDSQYAPRYNGQLNELGLTSIKDAPILEKIANAKMLTTGEAQATQVRDSENNILSTQTTSRLLGSLTSQHERIRNVQWEDVLGNNHKAAASQFSLLQPGLYKGHYAQKEYKGTQNRPSTAFTVSEYMHGAFIYDFVGGFLQSNNDNKVFKNGTVSFYPSVNSDKGTIGRIIVDLTQPIQQGPFAGKTFAYLTAEEIDIRTAFELGQCYESIHNKVLDDFQRLHNFIAETEGIDIPLNPDNDFGELNTYVAGISTNGKYDAAKWLQARTLKYNTLHPQNPIQLIDQTHFIKDKENKGNIMYNPTTQILRRRYRNPARIKHFMDLKRTELLSGLLKENFSVDLYDEPSTVGNQTPKQWLQQNYPTWVGSFMSKNGKMALAKITKDGRVYNITTKQDLAEFARRESFGNNLLEHPHELLNPKYGYTVELHPILSRYNSLDYLFTQEFMIAGVGSHINHQSKVKTKAPIIYSHPALGKSYSYEHGKYSDQFIDWDNEFNQKRDLWIELYTGTVKGTPEYQAARNAMMVDRNSSLFWRNNTKYREFVTREWNRVKAKANHQHKILFASPAMLLEMFPKDFDAMITMSKEEFLRRTHGDQAMADWKESVDATIEQFAPKTLDKFKIADNSNIYLETLFDEGALYQYQARIDDNEMLEESSRFLAQHKRNVSYTATMHEFQLNQVDGIPTDYNMAMIKGVPAWVYTIQGDVKNDQDAFDGATFVDPLVVIWENNSLRGNKAGVDKKQYVHFYDEATGTGGIIKTAGFGCTNDRARRYKFYRNMMWNMMKRDWLDEDGSDLIVRGNGILEDFNGNTVNYGTFFFKKANKIYARRILKYNGDNTYQVEDTLLDEKGFPLEASNVHNSDRITSNYDLWQLFGGERSMEITQNGELQYSEMSIELTARAANNYGVKKRDVVRSAEDVWQPMKHSDIHYMPTDGAVKQGAANINSSDKFFRRMTAHAKTNVENGLPFDGLDIMKVKMTQAGIQLDKEHHADKSVLSLMTQVMSAASAKSFMPEAQSGLKTALYELAKLGTRNFRDELGDLHLSTNGDQVKFNAAVTDIIVDAVINSTTADGTLIVAIAQRIKNLLGKDYTITPATARTVDQQIPYSSSEIFHKIVSALTVALTKRGIKVKMPGVLSVLCPAHEIVKFYKIPVNPNNLHAGFKMVTLEAAEDYFYENGISSEFEEGSEDWLNDQLDYLQQQEPALEEGTNGLYGPSAQLTNIGYKYLITLADGTQQVIRLVKPNTMGLSKTGTTRYTQLVTDSATLTTIKQSTLLNVYDAGYQDLVKMVNDNQVTKIQEWNRDGQDLRPYGVRFKSTQGNSYSLGDLDIVQEYFNFREIEDSQDFSKTDLQIFELKRLLRKYGAEPEFFHRVSVLTHKTITDYSQLPKDFIVKMGTGFLNRRMQIELNGISPSAQESVEVWVQGKKVTVDKPSIKIQSYGIIMPKVFASNLGLEKFDDIETIKNDPMFFTRRLVQRMGTRVNTNYPIQAFNKDGTVKVDDQGNEVLTNANNYDVEFKRMDGKHVYVKVGMDHADFGPSIDWISKVDENGNVFRIVGNTLQPMHSQNDKIYLDREGNEIIVTSEDHFEYRDANGNVVPDVDVAQAGEVYVNTRTGEQVMKYGDSGMKFYMDNLSYNTLNINTQSTKAFGRFLGMAASSENKVAVRYASILNNIPDIKTRKKLAIKMNDYSQVLDNNGEIKGSINRQLATMGQEMHTSFLRSLNIIAARIPAQNQQSFMPMECQAFDNPDINTAYVSIFQFFLQGSDLDIDAVSLQTFDIDKNGLYQGHSPYYSLANTELCKVSEKLPFPTGLEVQKKVFDAREMHFLYEKQSLFGTEGSTALFVLKRNALGTMQVMLNVDGSSINTDLEDDHERSKAEATQLTTAHNNLLDMIALLEDTNVQGITVSEDPAVLKDLAEYYNTEIFHAQDGEQLITGQDIPIIMAQIKKIIDRHNLYLKNAKPRKQDSIVKNYAVTQLFNIIADPINLIEAQSSVDTVTGPVKNLAKSSPKAAVQSIFTPGCVLNKFQSVNENMVGKDGISICATGLKSFFGITDMYQNILNGTDVAAKDSLLFDMPIGGRVYHGLANGFASRFRSRFEDNFMAPSQEDFSIKVQNYLLEQLWEDDASNGMSAFLGLSVDNAKELVLAKINAGTSTMGMYLYGLSIGVPTDTLYKIMTSPLAFRLAELTKGDIFNKDSGKFTVLNALTYLYTEPNLEEVDPYDWDYHTLPPAYYVRDQITTVFGLKDAIGREVTVLNKFIQPNAAAQSDMVEKETLRIKNSLEKIRTEAAAYLPANIYGDATLSARYIQSVNKIIDFIEGYIDDVNLTKQNVTYSTVYGESNLVDDIENLAMGAEELKLIGGNLSVNQGIKTAPDELISQVKKLEQFAVKRLHVLKACGKRHPEDKALASFQFEKDSNYKIDFPRFMTDDAYQREKIDQYDSIKVSYNLLRLIRDVKHYHGYFESLLIAYQGLNKKSLKWKALTKDAEAFIETYKVIDPKLQEEVYKNVERGVDSFLRDRWMLRNAPGIKIPKSTATTPIKVFVSNNRSVENKYDREILLGSPLGNANYKLYMESVVIPKLKQQFRDNKFIRSLTPVLNTATDIGMISVAYGLRINMLPKSDYEHDVFNEMKESFAQLSKEVYNGIPVQDLFYYYSMISFNGRVGPRSLHGIFEDFDGESIRSYRRFVCEADRDASNTFGPLLHDYLDTDRLAPFSTPYRKGSSLFKVKNKNTENVEVWTPFRPSEEEEMIYDENPEMMPKVINGYAISRTINPGANYTFFSEPITIPMTEKIINLGSSSIVATISPIYKDKKVIGLGVDDAIIPNDPKIQEHWNEIISGKTGIQAAFINVTPEGISLNEQAIKDHLTNNCV